MAADGVFWPYRLFTMPMNDLIDPLEGDSIASRKAACVFTLGEPLANSLVAFLTPADFIILGFRPRLVLV